MHPLRSLGLPLFAAVLTAAHAASAPESTGPDTAPVELPVFIVTATRTPLPAARAPFATDAFAAAAIAETPALTLDDALRGSAAFSLFRRTSSLTAHPTAQGVSLRGLGPSGASRSLVLLDGVPLNDPFGGWIAWSKIPRLSLAGAEIVRGGGSAVWGNAALGGVVQLLTEAPTESANTVAAEIADLSTHRLEATATTNLGRDSALRVAGRLFSTDGYHQFSPDQRGPVDRSLASRHRLLAADFDHRWASGWRIETGARLFAESRGNGTDLQRNSSRESAARLHLAGPLGEQLSLDLLAYAQRQHFSSTFTSIDAARAVETPALDQFDVPASALGGALVATFRHTGGAVTSAGTDLRWVSGETREDFLFSAGTFQRRRFAGGEQLVAGAFLAHSQPIGPTLDAFLSLRADQWSNGAGHRNERSRATGATLREDRYPDRHGAQFSPSAGLVWRARDSLRLRAAAYRGFRIPTLNEYYRPFRVGSVATEANPELGVETATTADLGVDFTRPGWQLSAGVFETVLSNAVANVTLSSTPALTQRQRLNLDRVRSRGLEARFAWEPTRALKLTLDYLLSDGTVRRASVAPLLVGKRLAQVPRHNASLRADWRSNASWSFHATARATSAQFDDDENRLRLAPFLSADLALVWRLQPGRRVTLTFENLASARIETARTADGLVALGPPCQIRVGVAQNW